MKRIENIARNIFTFDDELYEVLAEKRQEQEQVVEAEPVAKENIITKNLISLFAVVRPFIPSRFLEQNEEEANDVLVLNDFANDDALPPLLDEECVSGDKIETTLFLLDDLAESIMCPDMHTKPSLFLKAFKG